MACEVGFDWKLVISNNVLPLKQSRAILAGGNGILFVQIRDGVFPFFGVRPARARFAVAIHGDGVSPMARNSKRQATGQYRRRKRSANGWAGAIGFRCSIPFRQNQKGKDGRHICSCPTAVKHTKQYQSII